MSDHPVPAILVLGTCQLDLDRGTLRRNGTLVPLRAKSFGLLSHLARNAGRVVSKKELLDTVWPGVTVGEDSLNQAVRDVRKAISDEGYVLVPPEREAPAPLAPAPRVAVLPIRAPADPGDRDLFDGIVEKITDGLARFRGRGHRSALDVRVRSREPPGPGRGRERLGADYLVDGSTRRVDGAWSSPWPDRYAAAAPGQAVRRCRRRAPHAAPAGLAADRLPAGHQYRGSSATIFRNSNAADIRRVQSLVEGGIADVFSVHRSRRQGMGAAERRRIEAIWRDRGLPDDLFAQAQPA